MLLAPPGTVEALPLAVLTQPPATVLDGPVAWLMRPPPTVQIAPCAIAIQAASPVVGRPAADGAEIVINPVVGFGGVARVQGPPPLMVAYSAMAEL